MARKKLNRFAGPGTIGMPATTAVNPALLGPQTGPVEQPGPTHDSGLIGNFTDSLSELWRRGGGNNITSPISHVPGATGVYNSILQTVGLQDDPGLPHAAAPVRAENSPTNTMTPLPAAKPKPVKSAQQLAYERLATAVNQLRGSNADERHLLQAQANQADTDVRGWYADAGEGIQSSGDRGARRASNLTNRFMKDARSLAHAGGGANAERLLASEGLNTGGNLRQLGGASSRWFDRAGTNNAMAGRIARENVSNRFDNKMATLRDQQAKENAALQTEIFKASQGAALTPSQQLAQQREQNKIKEHDAKLLADYEVLQGNGDIQLTNWDRTYATFANNMQSTEGLQNLAHVRKLYQTNPKLKAEAMRKRKAYAEALAKKG